MCRASRASSRPFDRALLKGFQSFGSYLPGVAVPMVKEKMQSENGQCDSARREGLLTRTCADVARRCADERQLPGRSAAGRGRSAGRLRKYLRALQLDDIEVMSVKVSTIFSQISSLAYEHTLEILCDRLELLYRASAKATFTEPTARTVPSSSTWTWKSTATCG